MKARHGRWRIPLPIKGALYSILGGAVALITFSTISAVLRARREEDEVAHRALRAEHSVALGLSSQNAELERANRALTDANRALEAFTYVVSHDLKEPARALAELTRVLQKDHAPSLSAEGREVVQLCFDSTLRLQTLLQGLLEYGRAARIQIADLDVLRLEDVIAHAECRTRYESLLRERQGTVAVEAGPAVRASLPGLCQVIGNLILNAIKHNPRSGARVLIRSAPHPTDGRSVDVTIEDDGPGYPEVLVEQFNRIGIGERPATIHGGFGLLIAREATEKMGGRMRLGRVEGGGARTTLTLRG